MKTLILFFLLLSPLISHSQTFEWAKSHGVTSAYRIDRDTIGNLYVAANSYVAKFDPNGNIQWQQNITATDNYLRGLVAIPEGGVYITGAFGGSVTIGSYTLHSTAGGNANMYLVRYDENGNIDWVKRSISNKDSGTDDLTLDEFGSPIIIGRFLDSLKLDSFVFDAPSTNQIFLAKYSSTGTCMWAKHLKAASFSGGGLGPKVKSDGFGNSYIYGHFIDWIEFDSIHINAHGPYDMDIFLGKFDNSGEFLWVKTMGGTSQELLTWMDVDSSGNIYTTGYYSSTPACFDSFTLNNTSADDYFTAKYDTYGNCSWVKYGYSGVISACEDGYYTDYPDLVSKFDSLGTLQWSKAVGSTVYNNAMVAVEDTVFIAGVYSGSVSFDSWPLSSTSNQLYIAKLSYAPVSTDVIETKPEDGLNVYPNPGNGFVNIHYSSISPIRFVKLKVISSSGQVIHSEDIHTKDTSFNRIVDLSRRAKGIYTIEINSGNGQKSSRRIIVN